MSCCLARRQQQIRLGVIPFVPFAQPDPVMVATTAGTGGLGFGKAVAAGVAIYGITRVLDGLFRRGSRK